MSFLLTLPNEIFLQIIEDVVPDDIVNIADRLNIHRKGVADIQRCSPSRLSSITNGHHSGNSKF